MRRACVLSILVLPLTLSEVIRSVAKPSGSSRPPCFLGNARLRGPSRSARRHIFQPTDEYIEMVRRTMIGQGVNELDHF